MSNKMPYSHVTFVTWLTWRLWHDSSIRAQVTIQNSSMCDMTHSYVLWAVVVPQKRKTQTIFKRALYSSNRAYDCMESQKRNTQRGSFAKETLRFRTIKGSIRGIQGSLEYLLCVSLLLWVVGRNASFICDMTHDLFMCVTWLIHVCDMTRPCVWHDSTMCVTCLIHVCDMTHPCVWQNSSMCVTWLIHVCDMTHPRVWHDSSMCVTWLIHTGAVEDFYNSFTCDMTQSYGSWLWGGYD